MVENAGGLARCAFIRVTHVAMLDVIQKVGLGIKTIHTCAIGKTHVACLLEGLAIELRAALLNVWFGLGGKGWNARDECALESEVGTSAGRLDGRLEESINVSLRQLGTDRYTGSLKLGC